MNARQAASGNGRDAAKSFSKELGVLRLPLQRREKANDSPGGLLRREATVSLQAVLRHHQIPGLRRHRDQLQGCCRIHRGQRDDSFRARLTRNIFRCFACHACGSVLDFVAAMEQREPDPSIALCRSNRFIQRKPMVGR